MAGALKILGLVNFSSGLENSTAFAKSLEAFVYSVFISVSKSHMFCLGLRFSNKGLGVLASLGFYHSSPLHFIFCIFLASLLLLLLFFFFFLLLD